MDVRCEKCLTIYEFDEAQIGPNGVSVKCTQCGNLFKVKRKDTTAELQSPFGAGRSPAYTPPPSSGPQSPSSSAPQRPTHQGIPQLGATAQGRAVPAADEAKWLVRIQASKQIYSFREMTTLQQWIVERKVTRRDEISKDGTTWKVLGGLPELEPFFQVVDQARERAVPAAATSPTRPAPAGEDLAFTTTERMSQPPSGASEGPTSMGPLDVGHDDPAFAVTTPKPRATPASLALPGDDDLTDDLEAPVRRKRGALVLAAVGGILTGLGILGFLQRDLIKRWFAGASGPKNAEVIARAHAQMLDDTDEDFRQAAEMLAPARSGDDPDPGVTAALAEVNAVWGFYLREDARALDEAGKAGGSAAEAVARRLHKDAQGHIDEAKRLASEALQRAPDDPTVNRAMADYQRVDGAPAAEVERYLKRALDKLPSDPDAVFVAGALALRDGREDDARVKLEQANQLAAGAREHGLLRAEMLLARLALRQGRKDDARKLAEQILAASPQHERARAVLALTQAAAAVDAGVAAASPDAAAAKVAVAPVKKDNAGDGELPQSYDKLVEKADHLSENGRTDQARKMYERALELEPAGVEAMTGLGYCDLERERFMSAIDHFKRALSVQSSYGEAIIGMAEAYNIRGDRDHAAEFYRRYLKAQPNGPKATMAQKNLRDIEAAVEREKVPGEASRPAPSPVEPPP